MGPFESALERGMRKRVSFSQISLYLKCPRQYKFRYVEKISTPPSSAMAQSSAWHATVEVNFRQKMTTRKDISLKKMLEIFKVEFRKRFDPSYISEMIEVAMNEGASPEVLERFRKDLRDAQGMIYGEGETYDTVLDEGFGIVQCHHNILAPRIFPIGVEEKFTFELAPGIDFNGVWDVLEEGVVADNKAYGKSPNQGDFDKDLQFSGYAWAFRKKYGKLPRKIRMDCIVKNKVPKAVQLETYRTDKQIKWFEELVVEVVRGMNGGAFFPNTNGWHCSPKYCGYWGKCMEA